MREQRGGDATVAVVFLFLSVVVYVALCVANWGMRQ